MADKQLSYEGWRKAVFARDGRKCVQCGSEERLCADHILSFNEHPESRYDPANGRVLCHPCHVKTPTYGGKQHKGKRRIADPYGPS